MYLKILDSRIIHFSLLKNNVQHCSDVDVILSRTAMKRKQMLDRNPNFHLKVLVANVLLEIITKVAFEHIFMSSCSA
jgi:malate/lactate dehydrogenase